MYGPEFHYTEEDYWKVIESDPQHKYEYVDGYIRMMTGGSLAHAQITAHIISFLDNALRESNCIVYSSDGAVRLSEKFIYFPDVSVSCGSADRTRKRAQESPTVVVEVLSPATQKTDRGEKLITYQQFSTLQEILYVDSRQRFVEHHHRIGPHTWEVSSYTSDEEVIELSSIKVTLPLREIYRKVYLEREDPSEA